MNNKKKDSKSVGFIHGFIAEHKAIDAFLHEIDYRARIGIYIGMTFNLVYAIYCMFNGVFYNSLWMSAIGIYYLVIGLIRLYLISNIRRISDIDNFVESDKHIAIITYRRCGVFLLLLDISMLGIIIQMVRENKTYDYPGFSIFLIAIFTFYVFVIAIINLIRFSNNKNPILTASKNVVFSAACMSMLALQTALLDRFEGFEEYRKHMNTLTGCLVCVAVLCEAFIMIKRGEKMKSEL